MAESHLQKAIMSMSITVPITRMISKIAIVPIDLEDCRPSGALECLLIFADNFVLLIVRFFLISSKTGANN
jgi:hypothetical protein